MLKSALKLILLILPLAVLFGRCKSTNVVVSGDPMQWHKVVLTFEGPETAESAIPNPFRDYRLDVTFTGPSNQTYTVPGFYAADGNASESSAQSGNKWKVRFTPDEVGEWSFRASFVTGDDIAAVLDGGLSAGFFDRDKGCFTVAASDKDSEGKDFRGRGKLEYVGEHFLQFKGNKAYFLKVGTNSPEVFLQFQDFDGTPSDRTYESHVQDWKAGDPTWQSAKGKGLIGVVNYMSALDNNAFYFLTMNTAGDGKAAWPWIHADSLWRYDCSKLDQWDIVFEHMTAQGVMPHFVLSETENESFFEARHQDTTTVFADSRKIYYREMVARFGHHPAITWNIGEENGWKDYSGNHTVKKANTTEQRKLYSDLIRSLTYYNDHIVVHNGPSENYHIYDKPGDNILGHKSFTGPSMQGDFLSKKVYEDVLRIRRLSAENEHKWVTTMDEAYINKWEKGDLDTWRKDNVWAALMAGGAGIEFYMGGGLDVRIQDMRKFEDYFKTTAAAVGFFKTHIPFWELEPDEDFVENAWTLKKSGAFYLIYFKDGGTADIQLPKGEYSMKWYDPRNNVLHDGEPLIFTESTPQALRNPPNKTASDWACIIEKKI
ncbi:MAG: hypothetical protein ACJA01_000698 [Saprospiraceae bacterium]|jgi:hypothetical protein